MFELNLAEDYSSYLTAIGDTFLDFFQKRSQTLPLHIQIVCGLLSDQQLEDILKKKPYLANVHDDNGRVPLMVNCQSVYETLLKYGADPNACDFDGNTVLIYQRKHPEIIKNLVKAGADINATNNDSDTLMMISLLEGLPIQPLLELGATLPLPSDIPSGKADSIFQKCLLQDPLEVIAKIFDLCSPSEEAYLEAKIRLGCLDQKKYEWLKSKGHLYSRQKIKSFRDEKGIYYQTMMSCVRNRDFQKGKRILANIEECVEDRFSIMNCFHGDKTILNGVQDPDVLEFLLDIGADPNQGKDWKDNTEEETLLYKAICRHDHRVVKLLLDHGADPNTGTTYMDSDDTCIARAIMDNDLVILQMLINAENVDMDFAIRCNRTPILMAIHENNLPALKMVIDGGANPCLADKYGRVPEDYLSSSTSPEICRYFRSVVKKSKAKNNRKHKE